MTSGRSPRRPGLFAAGGLKRGAHRASLGAEGGAVDDGALGAGDEGYDGRDFFGLLEALQERTGAHLLIRSLCLHHDGKNEIGRLGDTMAIHVCRRNGGRHLGGSFAFTDRANQDLGGNIQRLI